MKQRVKLFEINARTQIALNVSYFFTIHFIINPRSTYIISKSVRYLSFANYFSCRNRLHIIFMAAVLFVIGVELTVVQGLMKRMQKEGFLCNAKKGKSQKVSRKHRSNGHVYIAFLS